jgi:hypothetical protein
MIHFAFYVQITNNLQAQTKCIKSQENKIVYQYASKYFSFQA